MSLLLLEANWILTRRNESARLSACATALQYLHRSHSAGYIAVGGALAHRHRPSLVLHLWGSTALLHLASVQREACASASDFWPLDAEGHTQEAKH